MKIQPLIAFGLESTLMLSIIIKEFPMHRGGITNKSFFNKMQVTNLTPSKNRLMHHLVPCIATSVQYFPNVGPIFCDGYLILGRKVMMAHSNYKYHSYFQHDPYEITIKEEKFIILLHFVNRSLQDLNFIVNFLVIPSQ